MSTKELWDSIREEGLEPIWEGPLDTWRWGVIRDEVYEVEGRLWRICYRIGTGNNDTNEFAEGYCSPPWEVEEAEEVVTIKVYKEKK